MGGPYHILPTSLNTRRAFMQERKTHACVYMRFACVYIWVYEISWVFDEKASVFRESYMQDISLSSYSALSESKSLNINFQNALP